MSNPNIVPFKFPDPLEDIEAYISFCENILPINDKTVKRTKKPKGFSEGEKLQWEMSEIDKCIYGDGIMCGSQYFYFNYCRIKNLGEGIIKPEFRVADNEYFKQLESCLVNGKNSGWGVITVKRRRAGFTWKAACFMLWMCVFFTGRRVGFDSKTEKDTFKLMANFVKFIYEGLPAFLKTSVDGGYNKANINFALKSEDEDGNTYYEGALSEMYGTAPVSEAHEGEMLHLWVSDEAGKKNALLSMWELTLPCMEQEGVRLGVPLIFGTAGDVDKGSYGLNELWKRWKSYKLIPFFFPGWMGMNCDKFGNDNVRKSIENVVKTRDAKAKDGSKDLFAYIQQYPLTPEEALRGSEVKGVGNEENIDKQKTFLIENHPRTTRGRFRLGDLSKGEDKVVFEPIDDTDVRLTKHDFLYAEMFIHPNAEESYDAGCDPADHDHVQKKASKMAFYIMRRPNYYDKKPQMALKMTGRPPKAAEYYEQSILALLYYNKAKVLIENNRFRMISYYEEAGFEDLLKLEPVQKNKVIKGDILNYGIRMNVRTRQLLEDAINNYTDNYCDLIYDESLLEDFGKYGEENTDEAIAFGWALVSLEDSLQGVDISTDPSQQEVEYETRLQNVNGVITRVQVKIKR